MSFLKPLYAIAAFLVSLLGHPAFAGGISVEEQKVDGRTLVLVFGPVEQGDELKFAELTASIRDAIIVFDSAGSPKSKREVSTSIEIGLLIHSRGYETAILHAGTCDSTCSLMWMAGKKRWIGEKAYMTVGNYLQSEISQNEVSDMYALIGYYLGKIGLKPEAIVFATSWRGANRFAAVGPSELGQLGIFAQVLDSRWIENATYPNGPLPPPPFDIAPGRK